jgi:hypothetical protein
VWSFSVWQRTEQRTIIQGERRNDRTMSATPKEGMQRLKKFQRVLDRLIELQEASEAAAKEKMETECPDDLYVPVELDKVCLQSLTALHLDMIVGKTCYAEEKEALYAEVFGKEVDIASYERGVMVHDEGKCIPLMQGIFLAALVSMCTEHGAVCDICSAQRDTDAKICLFLMQSHIMKLLEEEDKDNLFKGMGLIPPVALQYNDKKSINLSVYGQRVEVYAREFAPSSLRGTVARSLFYNEVTPQNEYFYDMAVPLMQVYGRKNIFFCKTKWDAGWLQGMKLADKPNV